MFLALTLINNQRSTIDGVVDNVTAEPCEGHRSFWKSRANISESRLVWFAITHAPPHLGFRSDPHLEVRVGEVVVSQVCHPFQPTTNPSISPRNTIRNPHALLETLVVLPRTSSCSLLLGSLAPDGDVAPKPPPAPLGDRGGGSPLHRGVVIGNGGRGWVGRGGIARASPGGAASLLRRGRQHPGGH